MHIVIIGNGISGITAARFLRKLSAHQITVISAETDHFFSRTALMYIYMGHMSFKDTQPYEPWFWTKNNISLKRAYVRQVDFEAHQLHLDGGEVMGYDKLILATGSQSNKFGWPGQELAGVRGLYNYQDLEYMEAFSEGLQRAVIVGGGLIGIEMAEMFHSRHIPVTFLVRERSYWEGILPPEESAMINRHILENGIDLRLSSELKEIVDDGTGRVGAVITSTGERIACGFVGLTAGVSPNVNFLRDSALEIQRGILVNERLETNLPDVYAIGDCAQLREPRPGRRPIEAIWYTGRMMGEVVAHRIMGKDVVYDPGIWFNSAKFFDIEYQIYGQAPSPTPPHLSSLYWEHSDGRKAIRIYYDNSSGAVTGFHLMGVRYRHEVCEKWIKTQTHIETVLSQLGLANFDPEFFAVYEPQLVSLYNQQTGKQIRLTTGRGLSQVLRFLGKA